MIKSFLQFYLLIVSVTTVGRFFIVHLLKYKNSNDLLSFHLVFGLFFFGSVSFIFNFFSGIANFYFFLILKLVLIFSFFYIAFKEKVNFKNLFNHLIILLFFCIIFIFYTNHLPPGYDAGLYHIPHQIIIQNEKIIVGLVNMHERFGLSTFFNYIAAILSKNNNFTLVSYLKPLHSSECNGFFIVRIVAGLTPRGVICCVSLQVWSVLLQVVAGLQIVICRN